MSSKHPLNIAIAGIGGFASAHHGVFAKLEEKAITRVVATCDPALDLLAEICELRQFGPRSVQTYKDFGEMLAAHAGRIDVGVIAAPIHLHAPMHEALVRNGAACYLEKPPTLDPGEFARMLAVEEHAKAATTVGFLFIHLQDRLDLKRRMVDGEFGRLKRMSFLGLTPRKPSYYKRNTWAGRLMLNDNLVLDSCLGNAMAHYLNNMLFFGGQEHLNQWVRPAEMACELYRGNPIQGTDTIFALCELTNGVELRLAASHACPNIRQLFEETMEFEHATITIHSSVQVVIKRPGQLDETFAIGGASLQQSVEYYIDYLHGVHPRPAQTLSDSLGFVETNALFYLAGQRIHDFHKEALRQSEPESCIFLPDVEDAARDLISHAKLPSQAGYAWAQPGGQSSIEAIPKIEQVVQKMVLAHP